MADETRTRQLGTGCLVLFALPFVGAGVLLATRAIRDLTGGAHLRAVAPAGLVAIAFLVAGIGVVALGWFARTKHDEFATLRAQHPAEPWLWNPQWARGRIHSSDRSSLAGAWGLALFWNTVSSFVFFTVPEELQKGNTVALLALLFPLVGVGILAWAVRATIRWRKYGTSTLELTSNPVPPGSELHARLRTRLDPPPDDIKLVLTCVRRDHSSDTTFDDIVFLDEHVVAGHTLRREVGGAVVPVVFTIPHDAPQSERNTLGKSVHWTLHATAAVSGVDYHSRFELPVFHVRDALQEPPRQAESATASRSVAGDVTAPPFDRSRATVRVGYGVHGHSFYFGAGRNPGAATGFGIMFGIFAAATYGIFRGGVPFIFVAVCGAFALLMLLIVLGLGFGTSRVEITGDYVLVRKSLLGIASTTRIPLDDVADVSLKIGMSQSETAMQLPRAWYDIKLHRRSGRRVTLGSNIADKREAEWLVGEIGRLVGLRTY